MKDAIKRTWRVAVENLKPLAILVAIVISFPFIKVKVKKSSPEPQTLSAALLSLQEYCQDYFKSDLQGSVLPVDFWRLEDDELFYQILRFLPSHLPEHIVYGPGIPDGFRLAYPVFWMDEQTEWEGWAGALENSDAGLAEQLIKSYRRMDMEDEARAWERVKEARDISDDEAVWEAAYLAESNQYRDEQWKRQAQKDFFCCNRVLFESLG